MAPAFVELSDGVFIVGCYFYKERDRERGYWQCFLNTYKHSHSWFIERNKKCISLISLNMHDIALSASLEHGEK